MEQKILTIPDLCRILGIGKTAAYELIKRNEIRSGRIGMKIIVRLKDLDEYIDRVMEH